MSAYIEDDEKEIDIQIDDKTLKELWLQQEAMERNVGLTTSIGFCIRRTKSG